MSVIDTATNTVVGSPMKLGVFATGVVVTPDGSRAFYVVGYTDEPTGAGRMSVIDTGYQHGGGFPDEAWGLPDGGGGDPGWIPRLRVRPYLEGVWVIAIQPPKAPTRVKAVAGNYAATVSWVRPPVDLQGR